MFSHVGHQNLCVDLQPLTSHRDRTKSGMSIEQTSVLNHIDLHFRYQFKFWNDNALLSDPPDNSSRDTCTASCGL